MKRNTCLTRWFAFGGAGLLAAAAGAGADKGDKATLDLAKVPAAAAVAVDFARDIKPLLAANCVSCHGPKKHEGGLRLSTKQAAFEGGDGGPVIVPGKGIESRLVHLVAGADPDEVMPPAKKAKPLSKDQVALLRAWIDQGANWPDGLTVVDGSISDHWAYKKPVRPELPAVKDGGWAKNPIDRFVLAKLESQGLRPSAVAAKATLLRRVSLDLTGLPPTREEVEAFEKDASPDAYEKAVDRLLASPHYGERWALPWLDLARYADSNGYEKDRIRSMWPYRDWVISALNRDMPFDQFTVEQLAGDLLPNATTDQKIATGFNRNTTLNEEGGVDENEYYFYSVVDRVNTTATVWLGTTLGCAQCHSHKYDPLSHKDYYRFFAYFNSTAPESDKRGGTDPKDVSARITVETPELAALNKEWAALKAKLDAPSPEIDAAQAKWEAEQAAQGKSATPGADEKPAAPRRARPAAAAAPAVPPNITALLAVPRAERDEKGRKALAAYYRTIAPALQPLRKQADDLRARIDAYPKTSLVMQELPRPRETFLHVRGGYLTLGEKVEPGVPAVFAGSTEGTPSADAKPQNRLSLARWLVSPENPLTARVTVNRMWEQYFGVGLVKTSEDFGTQGEPPSNQALLDWLACEFMKQGWGMKAMHRLIVTSATYRQSSRVTPELLEKDPYNRLLARGPRFRLPAELLRDQALAVSGLLSRKMGGPSVFPVQPDGIWKSPYSSDKWQTSDGEDRFRRGVYTFHRRSAPYPAFMAFDKTTLEASCTRRSRTDTPLQALTTLNDPASMQAAAALARRVVQEAGGDTAAKAAFAVRTVLARQPDPAEARRLASLYEQMRGDYEQDAAGAKQVADSGLPGMPKDVPPAELAAWTMVANVLLNLDETVTKE